jgi:hypothetical protein
VDFQGDPLDGKKKRPLILRIIQHSELPLVVKPQLGDLAHGALLEFLTEFGTFEVRVVKVTYVAGYLYLIRGFIRSEEKRRLTHRVEMLYKPYIGTGIARVYNN